MNDESVATRTGNETTPRLVWIALLVLAVLALGARVWHLGQPPFDFHGSRQFQNANNARSFVVQWDSSATEAEREVALRNRLVMEPPLLELATAAVWKVSGKELLWFPRLVSVLCWLAGGWVLWKLARRGMSPGASLVAVAFYWLAPFAIQGSRVFQPDPLMVLLWLLAVERIDAYHRDPSMKGVIQAGVVAALAMFVKPTCALLIAVFYLVLLLRRLGIKGLIDKQAYVFGAISLAPCIVYYAILLGSGASSDFEEHGSKFFIASLPLSGGYWRGWLVMIGRVVGWLPFLLALVGVASFRNQESGRTAGALLLAYFVYGLLFNYHIHTHDYYSLPLIAVVGLALGPILEVVVQRGGGMVRRLTWRHWAAAGAAGVVVLGGLAVVAKKMNLRSMSPEAKATVKQSIMLVGLSEKFYGYLNPGYYRVDEQVADQTRIGEVVGHSANLLMLTPDHGHSLRYYGRVAGWAWPDQPTLAVERDLLGIEMSAGERFAEKFSDRGIDYFVVTEFGDFEAQEDLREFLEKRATLVEESPGRFAVYRILPRE